MLIQHTCLVSQACLNLKSSTAWRADCGHYAVRTTLEATRAERRQLGPEFCLCLRGQHERTNIGDCHYTGHARRHISSVSASMVPSICWHRTLADCARYLLEIGLADWVCFHLKLRLRKTFIYFHILCSVVQ